MALKVIFIDWDGTLSNSKFWESCASDVLPPQVISKITGFLFRDSQCLIVDWMKGLISSSHIIAIVADRFNVDAQELHNALERSCRNMQLISSDVPKKIRKIQKQGIRVVIATDNMDTFENWTVPSLQLDRTFDGILSSPTQGALKAEIQNNQSPFFDLYFRQQGIARAESLLIDDSIRNKIVESIGMHFSHVSTESSVSTILESLISRAGNEKFVALDSKAAQTS